MKLFEMVRASDDGKPSNNGKVLEGVVFQDGTCVVRWCVGTQPDSTAIWKSFEDFETIHVAPRPGKERTTVIHWLNENPRN